MKLRFFILLPAIAVLAGTGWAQEVAVPSAGSTGLSLFRPEQRLLFAYPSEFVLMGFRKYDLEAADAAVEASLEAQIMRFSPTTDASARGLVATAPASSLAVPLGSAAVETPLLKHIGRFVLAEALRFGYQLFRESTRSSSLTEFDYLQLPQGTGMLRTSGEVLHEALLRGEMQALKLRQDVREMEKNAVGEQR